MVVQHRAQQEEHHARQDVGGGVWEVRLSFGPGYRVYFGESGRELVSLLLGGDKGTQTKDIKRARDCWAKHLKGAGA